MHLRYGPMQRQTVLWSLAPILGLFAILIANCSPVSVQHDSASGTAPAPHWNQELAAKYLDSRENWWINNMGKIDHGTSCVSCHTSLPYALARPSLDLALGRSQPSAVETEFLASVRLRVENSGEMQPFLSGPSQSKGTESVLNVVTLANYQPSELQVGSDVKIALNTLWKRQIETGPNAGSWNWFSLGNEPWEAPDSRYWGASLAAASLSKLPKSYLERADVVPHLQLLKSYLINNRKGQSLHNLAFLLLASKEWPDLLNATQQQSIIMKLLRAQKRSGGWRLADLIPNWSRNDGTPQHPGCDAYATAISTFVLEQSKSGHNSEAVKSGRMWLINHQNQATGAWQSWSVNKRRDPASDIGKFMSDAATSYAILALSH